MRRKRRNRGTWFPTLGTGLNEGADHVPGLSGQFDVPTNGTKNSFCVPLTFDDPQEDDEAVPEAQLTEFVGQEYILHSIIGNIFASHKVVAQQDDTSEGPAALLSCGFFVARSADDAGATTDSLPIGASSLALLNVNYSALSGTTIRNPWIFRRTWILGRGRGLSTTTGFPFVETTAAAATAIYNSSGHDFPPTTAHYNGLNAGAFFKTKSRRRVARDERLWFTASACNWPLDLTQNINTISQIQYYLDYRIFGALVKARNRSVF